MIRFEVADHTDCSIRSRQSNAFNFNIDVLRESLDGDATAGRLVSEPLRVLLVHLGEEAHICQEDVHFDHLFKPRAGFRQDGLQILKDLSRLFVNGALDEVALRIHGDRA